MKYGIVIFPGSNCDSDAFYAVSVNSGASAQYLWHKDTNIPKDIDCIILPGGFSYGDYLRSGAIARFSPIMNEVIRFAERGGYVLGICNGFQTLCEAGLLPGTLMKNSGLRFICKDIFIKTMNNSLAFTSLLPKNEVLKIPIAHFDGNYVAEPDTLKKLSDDGRIVFKFCSPEGMLSDEFNPNGSIMQIAGIANEKGNVMGMMPHPERNADKLLGNADGLKIFESLNNFFN